ncbi:MAG: homoserine dehydrogenase [Bacteroidales bacterium]
MRRKIKLGIFGFGCVGQGLYGVLQQTLGINAEIKKICIKHPYKKRPIESSYFTTDAGVLLNDPEIDVIVELIDDVEAAFEIVTSALRKGKAVVSANKKMIAENFMYLYELQQEMQASFLYEASSCASIPIIRNLEEYYDNDLLNSVEGIFNGSTNYILTSLFENNMDFGTALRDAQLKGFAETDPSLDVDGYDSKYKLCIILAHAFGLFLKPEDIFNYGIRNINTFDIQYAREKNLKIKLLAKCRKTDGKVYAYVMPGFVPGDAPIAQVENEYNGIIVEGAFSEHQFFTGKGAGGNPTGSAVLSDISALTYNYRYEYKKKLQGFNNEYTKDIVLDVYVRFPSGHQIDNGLFEEIAVKYESPGYNYLLGKINLGKLWESGLTENEKVSIILNATS